MINYKENLQLIRFFLFYRLTALIIIHFNEGETKSIYIMDTYVMYKYMTMYTTKYH